MIKILKAEELYKISQQRIPEIVAKIMNGVKEHIIERCEEEANNGATYYTIHLRRGNKFVKNKLVEECLELAEFFEKDEYKISIEDTGKDSTVSIDFSVSWDGTPHIIKRGAWGINKHIYDTDNGLNDEYFRE